LYETYESREDLDKDENFTDALMLDEDINIGEIKRNTFLQLKIH
jgi:hypothetical protein